MTFKILRENNYLPSMIFYYLKSLFKIHFDHKNYILLTDFQNFCRSCKDKLRSRCCKENIVPALQKTEIQFLPENPVSETRNHTLERDTEIVLHLCLLHAVFSASMIF